MHCSKACELYTANPNCQEQSSLHGCVDSIDLQNCSHSVVINVHVSYGLIRHTLLKEIASKSRTMHWFINLRDVCHSTNL